MTRLLHVADSYLGVEPYASAERGVDLWNGFRRAVDAAIAGQVDIFLHAGMLLSEFADLAMHAPAIRIELDRLQDAGITPVLHQTHHDLVTLDVDCVLVGEPALEVRDVWIGSDVRERTPTPGVVVCHGRVDGIGGLEPALGVIDPQQLIQLHQGYVALGGANRMQPVQPNAWYSGQTARVDLRDTYRVGGLIVDLGEDGQVRSLSRVAWGDRPHHRMAIEGLGLSPLELATVLEARVRELELTVQPEDPAPVVHVQVRCGSVTLEEARAAGHDWYSWIEQHTLYARIDWNGSRTEIQARRNEHTA